MLSFLYNYGVRKGTYNDYFNYDIHDFSIKLGILRSGPGGTIDCSDYSLDRIDVYQSFSRLDKLKYRAAYRFIFECRNCTSDYRLRRNIPG